jgi:hypothetical protein
MLLAALLMMATSPGEDAGWARFSMKPALARTEIEVEIGTAQTTGRPVVYWFRRMTRVQGKESGVIQIDTRSCPKLTEALRSLQELSAPHAVVPFLDSDDVIVTADGVRYSLTVPAAYRNASSDDMTLQSNEGTPLADWIKQTLATLQVCSSSTP